MPSNCGSEGLPASASSADRQLVLAEAGNHVAVRPGEVGADEVHGRRADELGHEEVDGPVVERRRSVDLLEDAVAHHGHAVAERDRLDLVVRDVDGRHLEVALEPRDLGPHLHAQLGVEVRERLVHEERLRLAHDRAAHGDALALSARERARALREHALEPEHLGGVSDSRLDLGSRDLAQLQPERHVLEGRHVRVERVVLEDHRDVAVLRRQVVDDAAADPHGPAGDRLEACHHPQRRGLAAARRPD